ncbi:hypothetical protein KC353_g19545, partial [Hortaea werneckii]
SPRVDSARPSDSPICTPMTPREKNKLADSLYAAACAGDLDHIKLLLSLGAPINAGTMVEGLYEAFKPAKPGLLSPLAGAARNGQMDAVELLIAAGAEPNPNVNRSSSSPLHQAIRADDLELSRLLLELGANINSLNDYKTTPLMYAVKYGSAKLVELILEHHPDMDRLSFIGAAAIHWANFGQAHFISTARDSFFKRQFVFTLTARVADLGASGHASPKPVSVPSSPARTLPLYFAKHELDQRPFATITIAFAYTLHDNDSSIRRTFYQKDPAAHPTMSQAHDLHRALLRPAIIHTLRAAGFHSTRPSVLDTLVNIAERYMLLLASTTAQHAYNTHNDPIPTVTDVRMALADCGALTPADSATEEEWRELMRIPVSELEASVPKGGEKRAIAEKRKRDEQDVQDIKRFRRWFEGDTHAEMRRIAGLVPDASVTGAGANMPAVGVGGGVV